MVGAFLNVTVMKITFLKDHLDNKTGDTVTDHPHSGYLVKMGVAEEAKEKVEAGNKKEKVDMVKPETKKKR